MIAALVALVLPGIVAAVLIVVAVKIAQRRGWSTRDLVLACLTVVGLTYTGTLTTHTDPVTANRVYITHLAAGNLLGASFVDAHSALLYGLANAPVAFLGPTLLGVTLIALMILGYSLGLLAIALGTSNVFLAELSTLQQAIALSHQGVARLTSGQIVPLLLILGLGCALATFAVTLTPHLARRDLAIYGLFALAALAAAAFPWILREPLHFGVQVAMSLPYSLALTISSHALLGRRSSGGSD
jgi:hypothetical protein